MKTCIWGIIFIIAGLSGQLTLIGTNSSLALVGVGVVMTVWSICSGLKHKNW